MEGENHDWRIGAIMVGVAVAMLGFTLYLGVRMLLEPEVLARYQLLPPAGAGQLPWYVGYALPYVIPLALLYILATVAGRMFRWGLRFMGKTPRGRRILLGTG